MRRYAACSLTILLCVALLPDHALVHIGSAAEPAVLALLKEKNIETRMQACTVLKQIGTKKSLGPLKDLTLNPSKELSEAAAEACRSIQSREAK
jgi:HEAT repeat protein